MIRKIQPADDPDVAKIIRTVMTEFGAVGSRFSIADPEVDAMFGAYANPKSIFYVLEDRGSLVGCGGIAPLVGGQQDTCELKKMYLMAQARGKGLGTLLCEMLIVDAQRFAYRQIYIETLARMEAAIRVYEKLGFDKLPQCLGQTGHVGCDTFYARQLEPLHLDASLLR